MKTRIFPAVAVIFGLSLFSYVALNQGYSVADSNQGGDKDDPPKPTVGDREDIVFQNQRFLTVKNDTESTLTVSFQYRTLVKDAFTWLPAVPKDGAEALSFEIKAGEELKVKAGDDFLAASRVRLWATSETEKWLAFKTRDLWLVPEKNEEGDHVYPGESPETFTFTFTPKKGDMDDPDLPIGSTFPGQDPSTLIPEVFPQPGELIPGGGGEIMPVIQDLSVLPVNVSGPNVLIRVKNKGHASENVGRNLFVKKAVLGAVPSNLGPIGLLFHHQVRPFNVAGLTPGDYIAFISPGDDPPFDANDARPFTVANVAIKDLRVLKVFVAGGKAKIRVKNVGNVDFAGGRKLKVVKLPGGLPKDVGDIGPLDVNKVQTFPDVPLASGVYKAFISPGDAGPFSANDSWTFTVSNAFADLKVLPVAVIASNVHVQVKNVGNDLAAAGKDLMVLKQGALNPINKGPIGALLPGASKPFVFPLPPGNYKAFIKPGDPAPHAGNDFDNFTVSAAPFVDLHVLNVTVLAGNVHVKVKNVGTAPSPAGRHLKVLKMGALNPTDHGDIGLVTPGNTKIFAPFALPPGNYKAFISPGDPAPHAGNDFDNFTVAAPAVPDLAVGIPTKAGAKVKATISNNGPGKYTAGARQWHMERLMGMNWVSVGNGNVPTLDQGTSTTVQGNFTGAGTYRIRLTGSDGNSANDSKSKAL